MIEPRIKLKKRKSRAENLREAGKFLGLSVLAIMLVLFILGWIAYAFQAQAAPIAAADQILQATSFTANTQPDNTLKNIVTVRNQDLTIVFQRFYEPYAVDRVDTLAGRYLVVDTSVSNPSGPHIEIFDNVRDGDRPLPTLTLPMVSVTGVSVSEDGATLTVSGTRADQLGTITSVITDGEVVSSNYEPFEVYFSSDAQAGLTDLNLADLGLSRTGGNHLNTYRSAPVIATGNNPVIQSTPDNITFTVPGIDQGYGLIFGGSPYQSSVVPADLSEVDSILLGLNRTSPGQSYQLRVEAVAREDLGQDIFGQQIFGPEVKDSALFRVHASLDAYALPLAALDRINFQTDLVTSLFFINATDVEGSFVVQSEPIPASEQFISAHTEIARDAENNPIGTNVIVTNQDRDVVFTHTYPSNTVDRVEALGEYLVVDTGISHPNGAHLEVFSAVKGDSVAAPIILPEIALEEVNISQDGTTLLVRALQGNQLSETIHTIVGTSIVDSTTRSLVTINPGTLTSADIPVQPISVDHRGDLVMLRAAPAGAQGTQVIDVSGEHFFAQIQNTDQGHGVGQLRTEFSDYLEQAGSLYIGINAVNLDESPQVRVRHEIIWHEEVEGRLRQVRESVILYADQAFAVAQIPMNVLREFDPSIHYATAMFDIAVDGTTRLAVQYQPTETPNVEYAFSFWDRNRDRVHSPLDILIGINDLNAKGPRALTLTIDTYSLDANGDGYRAPGDELRGINRLNSRLLAEGETSGIAIQTRAEGEAPLIVVTSIHGEQELFDAETLEEVYAAEQPAALAPPLQAGTPTSDVLKTLSEPLIATPQASITVPAVEVITSGQQVTDAPVTPVERDEASLIIEDSDLQAVAMISTDQSAITYATPFTQVTYPLFAEPGLFFENGTFDNDGRVLFLQDRENTLVLNLDTGKQHVASGTIERYRINRNAIEILLRDDPDGFGEVLDLDSLDRLDGLDPADRVFGDFEVLGEILDGLSDDLLQSASSLGIDLDLTRSLVSDYVRLQKRAGAESILVVARDITLRILYLPEADQTLVSIYKGALGIGRASVQFPDASQAVQLFNDGILSSFILTQRDIHTVADTKLPIIAFVDDLIGENQAERIAQQMKPGELFVGVWDGELNNFNKPAVMAQLYNHANRSSFKVRDMPQELVSDAAIHQLVRHFDTPAISISRSDSSGDLDLNLRNGDRIKIDVGALVKNGIDPVSAISLLKQLADNPDVAVRRQNFMKAGFESKGGFWEIGNGLASLIEQVYAEMSAQEKIAAAA